MTFDPLVFDVFGFEITGYGIMMMFGFLAAGWVMHKELERRDLNAEYAWDVVVAAVIGGVLGAKLWYVALHGPQALFRREGLVWYGGFIGGFLAVSGQGWWRKVPFRFTLELTAPALALGYALGRVGCFLVQDDYGVPTDLPWAFTFPKGLPPTTAANLQRLGVDLPPGTPPDQLFAVHPTQLYEVLVMTGVFFLLWRLRKHEHAVGWLFGVYLVSAGTERFLVEFLRAKDDRMLGAFTVAQFTSVLLVSVGVALMLRWWRKDALTVRAEDGLKPETQPA